MALKIVIALGLIAIVIIIASIALRFMNKKDEEAKESESIPTFDFRFDKHHKEEEKE